MTATEELTAGERRILERDLEQTRRWRDRYARWAQRRDGTTMGAYWLDRIAEQDERIGDLEHRLAQ